MRSLNGLVTRSLAAHRLRSLLTVLAIASGVAMVLAAAVVGQAAGRQAAELAGEGRVDLEVVPAGRGRLAAGTLETLRASPAVERAAPSLRIEVRLAGPAFPPLDVVGIEEGHYPRGQEPALAAGILLSDPSSILLPEELARQRDLPPGSKLALAAAGQTLTVTVAGWLEAEPGIEAPLALPRASVAAGSGAAMAPLALVQALDAGPGGQAIDRVEVWLRPGSDPEAARRDLARALGPEAIVARAVDGQAQGTMGNVLLVQGGLAAVGLIILFAGGFVILNAFAMAVAGRLRELGTLRALGMRRGLGRDGLARLVLAEAALLGLAGTAAGLLAGPALAWGLMQAMGTLEGARLAVPPWAVAAGLVLGLGVTLAAALQPAWQAGRVAPIVAARSLAAARAGWYETRAPRLGRWLLALSMAGMAAFGFLGRPSAWIAQAAMIAGQGLLLGAAVLLLPGLVAPLAALVRPLLERRLGTAGRLAADNLGRNRPRAALTAGALAAGLTVMVASSGLMTAGLKGGITRISTAVREDAFIAGDLEGMVAAQQLTVDNFLQFIATDQAGYDLNAVVDALQPLVAAGRLGITRYRFLPIPAELSAIPGAPGLFVDPRPYLQSGNFDFFEGDPEAALRLMERGRAVLLLPIAAERLGVGVGDEVTLPTPRGAVRLTVAGIGGGALMMPLLSYADAQAWYGVKAPSFLGLVVPGGDPAVLAEVQALIDPLPGVHLLDHRASVEPVVRMVDRLELLLDGLLLLAVMVAALGVVNTVVINVSERRREIGLLRAVGATRRQVQQAIVAEAAVLGLLAALVAAGLGLLMLLSWGLLVLPYGTASVGVRPDWETVRLTVGAGLGDWARTAAVALLFGPLVAGLAAALPARRAAALEVVQALGSE